jgi:hypothetical protein
MIIVGKATQEPQNRGVDYVEVCLPQYRGVYSREGRFAYAWTFSPDDDAIAAIRQNLPAWLYLVGEPWFAPLRMRIVGFRHSRQPLHCPEEWRRYCIPSEWCITRFPDQPRWPPIHLWFLVDRIRPVQPSADVRDRTRFRPLFGGKYQMYGRMHFGFFR